MFPIHIGDDVEFILQTIPLNRCRADLARFVHCAPITRHLLDDVLCFGSHGNDDVGFAADESIHQLIMHWRDLSPCCERVTATTPSCGLIYLLQCAALAHPGVRE